MPEPARPGPQATPGQRFKMGRAIRILAVLVLGACLAGCSTGSVYNIKVNGFTSPEKPARIRPGGRFYVMANKAAKNPLLDAEVRDKIIKLLESHGYPVTDYERADYYLFFTYGRGEPRSLSAAAPEYYGTFGWGWGWGWKRRKGLWNGNIIRK